MRRSTRYITGFLIILGLNCDPTGRGAPNEKTIVPTIENDSFFGDSLLDDTTALGDDFSTVVCPGIESPKEDDYRVIRGRVFAPNGQFTSLPRNRFGIPFVRTATAVTLPNDGAVTDANIAIYNLENETIATTTSDALGRWCLNVGDVQFGPQTRISATKNGVVLRRMTPFRETAVVTPVTEAFVRIVGEKTFDRSTIINAKMVSETTVQLLLETLPEGSSVEDAVIESMALLRRDPRLKTILRL